MKQQRTVNIQQFLELSAFYEGEGNFRKWLANEAVVSISLVNNLFQGKCPGVNSQLRICRALKIKQEDAFPVYEAEKASA
jgi:DNA-binding Xre family transcriptional regulator